jgi:hypothetical protein
VLIERQGNFVLTRLHLRYDKSSLTEDLELRSASNASGGISAPKGPNGDLPTTVNTAAEKNQFQTRYVSLHPNKVVVKCENPKPFRWAKPPRTYRGANKIWVANQLASRNRSLFKPQEVVLASYDALGLPGVKAGAEGAATAPSAGAGAAAKSGGFCAVSPGVAQNPVGLLGVGLSLLLLRLRRRR